MADSELLDLGVEKPVTTRQYSHKLSSPTPFLWTMVLFLILVGFLAAILYRQAHTAFMTNPGLNGFILGVLAIGIILVFTQTMSLRSEVRWFNAFRAAGSVEKVGRAPKLLAPMSTLIGKRGEVRLSAVTQRTILDSIATRLDETRDTSRYLVGLLVFLGLLGTFWGLIGTIGAISNVIQSLDPSAGDSNDILSSLKAGLTAPLAGMGTAFSSSLLGLSGSLILGFLDLQAGRAQNRFYTQLENWLSSVTDTSAEMPREFKAEAGAVVSTERSLAAMTSLAEGIQGLVKNMRSEQQMLRDWIEAQQEESRSLRRTLDRLSTRIDGETKSSRTHPARQRERVAMALARNRRRDRGVDYWPGFVDALSTLLMAIMFLLTVFVLAQFVLSREITGKDEVLTRLNSQIAELTELLAMEKGNKQDIEDALASLQSTLAASENERSRLQSLLDAGSGNSASANARIGSLTGELDDQKQANSRASAQIELLNQQIAALRAQIASVEAALQASEAKDASSQVKIADLGRRLNVALAQRVQELNRYRSDFFGRLREILSDRENIRIVGDRFVFQSEVLFPSGGNELNPEGQAEMEKLATALIDLAKEIPAEINWVLRVDGHTDNVQLSGSGRYRDNWELSSARATSVVKFLISKGVPSNRLVAAGFGEYQPIAEGDTPEARQQNRRIELKLTER